MRGCFRQSARSLSRERRVPVFTRICRGKSVLLFVNLCNLGSARFGASGSRVLVNDLPLFYDGGGLESRGRR